MAFIRIVKIFSFEMAHFLQFHTGLCRNIHGHSYLLHICIGGFPSTKAGDPQYGMVLYFSILKQIVQREIIEKFDHSFVISQLKIDEVASKLEPLNFKIVSLPFEPTSENMVSYFADKIRNEMPADIKLISIKLYETATSYVEWFASDNE